MSILIRATVKTGSGIRGFFINTVTVTLPLPLRLDIYIFKNISFKVPFRRQYCVYKSIKKKHPQTFGLRVSLLI